MNYQNINDIGYSTKNLSRNGNNSLSYKMLVLFTQMTAEYIEGVTRSIKNGDVKKINSLAHWIKPSIDILCINSLTRTIREIEMIEKLNPENILKIDFSIQRLKHVISCIAIQN